MKGFYRIFPLITVFSLIFTLCACSSGSTQDKENVWYLGGNNSILEEDVDAKEFFVDVQDTINPAQIYQSTELTEKMLHGAYTLNNKEKDLKKIRTEIPFEDVVFTDDTLNLSILPVAVYLGAENICSSLTSYRYSEFEAIEDYEVAVLELATQESVGRTPCTYEIDGSTITFKQISQTSKAEEPFEYEFTGVEFSYNFTISGPYMTFSKNGHSLKLTAYCFTDERGEELWMSGYSLPDSPLIGNLDYFSSSGMWNYAVRRDGVYFDTSAFKLDEEGRFTVYLSEKDIATGETETFVNQYAYIIQSEADSFMTSFTLILLDGEKVYYYTDDITQREARALEEQGADISTLTEDEIKEIAEKKASLFDDLYAAFEAAGINATINRSTGEIALDSTVLFGVNESAVSDEGKSFLQKFMGVYVSVVFDEKYEGFISKIMVEGHTDTTGSYELNQELSQARADSVKDYCLSPDCSIDAAYADTLQGMLEAIGHSYDKPVYDENGQVDMDASRRVSFRFIINLQQN